ncbi:MAG: methylenetetrahydrofolate reductase [Desulfamplus sp.]|nr:methylenetetrahydrofolate reductase [Desulfamplus sp.]
MEKQYSDCEGKASDNNGYAINSSVSVAEIDLDNFVVTVEVVPPHGGEPCGILSALDALKNLPISGFSVASNPVAKPHMSAMALCSLIQQKTGKFAIMHATTRDNNRISLQSTFWGANALGIKHVLAVTGDFVALSERKITSDVKDMDVFQLIEMAKNSGMITGAVLDFRPEINGLEKEVERLEKKAAAGAMFAVTQPIYDRDMARTISISTSHIDIPIIMGILPLRTSKHAEFLHNRVAGIVVPEKLREKMNHAKDPIAEGVANAREMLAIAKEFFRGACIMPPFGHYEVMADILK